MNHLSGFFLFGEAFEMSAIGWIIGDNKSATSIACSADNLFIIYVYKISNLLIMMNFLSHAFKNGLLYYQKKL